MTPTHISSEPTYSPSETSLSEPTFSPTYDPNFAVVEATLFIRGWPFPTIDSSAKTALLTYLTDIVDIEIVNVTASYKFHPLNRRSLLVVDDSRRLTTSWELEAIFNVYTASGSGTTVTSNIDYTCSNSFNLTYFNGNLDASCGCMNYSAISSVTCGNKVMYDNEQIGGADNSASNALLSLIALLVLVVPYYYYYRYRNKMTMSGKHKVYAAADYHYHATEP